MIQRHVLGPDELLIAFHRGEERAFDQVFRQYHASLTWFAQQFTHNEAASEDIVQDCFLQLWKKRKKLEDVRSINSYLYTTVRNTCLNFLRKSGREKEAGWAGGGGVALSSEEVYIAAEVMRNVIASIDRLPARMAQIARLHFVDGLTIKEIAGQLGTGIKTIEFQRRRAIQLLKKENITSG